MDRTSSTSQAQSAGVTLNYSRESWPLRQSVCPCDVHFLAFLAERGIADKAIFHFGTGEHHVLGIENAKAARPNHILAVTASRQEYERYIDLVVTNPLVANTYKTLFADIYTLDARVLPNLDVVTLFHLCEFYDPERSGYAPLDDRRLLDLFLAKLNPAGRICFYLGSNGRDAMLHIVRGCVADGKLAIDEQFQSLLICTKPPLTPGKADRARDLATVSAFIEA